MAMPPMRWETRLEVWVKSGAAYGLEVSQSISVEAP
jgi:hypothetical protein